MQQGNGMGWVRHVLGYQTASLLLPALLATGAVAQESAGTPPSSLSAEAMARLGPLLGALGRGEAIVPAEGVRFLVQLADGAPGLAPGAPVTFQGLRIGSVREVSVAFDSTTGRLAVPVAIDIAPGALSVDGQHATSPPAVQAAMALLVQRGLRARLAGGGMLAGAAQVTLEIVPAAAPAQLGQGSPPEIPSLPPRPDAMAAMLERMLAELDKLPLDQLAADATTTLTAVRELVTSPELRQAAVDLATAAGELRITVDGLAERADPLVASLTRTLDAAGPAAVATLDAARGVLTGPELASALGNLTALTAELRDMPAELQAQGAPLLASATTAARRTGEAAGDAQRTLAALDATFGSRSTFRTDLATLLREATGAVRSLRQLLDLLTRQPDVLLRGKRDAPPP